MAISTSQQLPTAQSMKIRFPEFADLEDAQIEMVIDEIQDEVDDSWIESDQVPALMYLAAHTLSCGSIASDSVDGEVASLALGRMSMSFRGKVTPQSTISDRKSTWYGQQYLRLLKKSKPAILVISSE